MKRTMLFLWFTLLLVWLGMRFGSRVWFVEKFRQYHCKLEWIQPQPGSAFEEYQLVCPKTGRKLGEVLKRDGMWNALSVECWLPLNEDFTTREQAMKAVEKCQ